MALLCLSIYFSLFIYFFVLFCFSDFPDVFVPKPEEEISERNGSITLECLVKAVPDCNIYSWTHVAPDNKTKVKEYAGNVENNVLRLSLNDISYMDSGMYICSVSNGVEDYQTHNLFATKDIHLLVKGLYTIHTVLLRLKVTP